MYRIGKRLAFEAAHCLDGLPLEHKCSRLHGHSYTVELVLSAPELDEQGFVTDFGDLWPLAEYVANTLDHRVLNDVITGPPTSERLARHLYDWCVARLHLPGQVAVEAVRVSETASTWAEFRPERCDD
ncbi:6-pyruvoyl trahydropterin synthase family protein [Actinomadura sp. SCN-SB]|uniref:6-pyruvoyl trahydropterin synthase family protein n=1 Tax=Actinomadura sp. SCN-SB TaxID=3373092 RepID=UPI0037518B77